MRRAVLLLAVLAAACTGQTDFGVEPQPIEPVRDMEVVEGFAVDLEEFGDEHRICLTQVFEAEDHRRAVQDYSVEMVVAAAAEDVDDARVAYEGVVRHAGGYLAALDEAETVCTDELSDVVRTEKTRSRTIATTLEHLRDVCEDTMAAEGWNC